MISFLLHGRQHMDQDIEELKAVLFTVFPAIRDIDKRPLPGEEAEVPQRQASTFNSKGVDCDAVFTENLLVGNL